MSVLQMHLASVTMQFIQMTNIHPNFPIKNLYIQFIWNYL